MSDLSGVTPQDIRDAALLFTIPSGGAIDAALQKTIDKAELRIVAHVPDLQARLDDARLDPAVLASVVEDMVLRVARNPDGKRSESIDDYSWTLDSRVSAGMLYLSDEELGLLVPPERPRAKAIGSIRIAVPSWRLP